MTLDKLIFLLKKNNIADEIYLPEGIDADKIELNDMVCDSRNVRRGDVFAATKGEHADAHNFIPRAAEDGAAAVLCERKVDFEIPQIICRDVRASMGEATSILYGEPSKKLTMIAVTGTNGKTTSTFMAQSILQAAGIKTGIIGTVQYDDGKIIEEANHTTPEGCDIQNLLSRMVNNGCGACVMEAASQPIMQGRINGTTFDCAGFTNLTIEHLDYHGNMENYFLAKKSLFDKFMKNDWSASVNIDDAYGGRLCDSLGKKALTYSMKDESADYFARIKNICVDGLDIEVKTPQVRCGRIVRLPLLGSYNVLNMLQALSLVCSVGVSADAALDAVSAMPQIPGRLERYSFDNGASCVIDFAHTPDGLEKVLSAVRPVCRGRLSVVFGAGGDRDRSKRPVMGEIAARLADEVIITSDNPRSEDPDGIISEIAEGVKKHKTAFTAITDRRAAIYEGLSRAGKGDIVVIAGRGPETHQILKGGPIPLVDKEIMSDWCRLNERKTVK